MKIELLGALDYAKVENLLKDKKVEKYEEIIDELKQLEKEQRVSIVSMAGRLSRFAGNVFEVLGMSQANSFEKNIKFAQRVLGYGYESISEHDYCVFAIQDVSPVVEQTIIEERFCSFTIKSRREVDFSNVGFYTPDFHSLDGKVLSNNDKIQEEYKVYMSSLFDKYSKFEKLGIPKEDARFVLPYCYYSNIIMGVDAHTLKDMIVKFTKTKYAHIQELREFGECLKAIAEKHIPYIIESIENEPLDIVDKVDMYLQNKIQDKSYRVLGHAKLLNHTDYIDDTILISSIMRRYQFDLERAKKVYMGLCQEYPDFKRSLMRKIAFGSDGLELTQVNFQFQIPLSFAVLTHLTRHRTHDILVPDFAPIVDLSQYKIPPKVKNVCLDEFEEVFGNNYEVFKHFKEDYGICEEDLVYFTLSGNLVNVISNMDGKTLAHILALRECTKAQWETRNMAYDMHKEINKIDGAKMFSGILGSTCVTQGYCNEGKESCGKILKLNNLHARQEV